MSFEHIMQACADHASELGRRADERARVEQRLAAEMAQLCAQGMASAIADFAGRTADFSKPADAHGVRYMREQSLAEVMADTFSHYHEPGRLLRDACMQLVLDAARGHNVQADAHDLIRDIAREWASANC